MSAHTEPDQIADTVRGMMVSIWPKKAGEDTVAWRDTCSWCGQEGPDHPYASCFEDDQSDG